MSGLKDRLALRNRRGAFAVIFALLSVVMMGVAGIAIDMSRVATMKTELQTVADAAALAGALQLQSGYTRSLWDTKAKDYVLANRAMGTTAADTARVDSLKLGKWNAGTRTFAVGPLSSADAVEIKVSRNVRYFFASVLGINGTKVNARAVGWAGAPVNNANCLKPWALPHVMLMQKINVYRGITNDYAGLTRPWDPVADKEALQLMSVGERTFTLKMGSQSTGANGISDPTIGGAEMAGNYYAVALPKYWDAASQEKNPDVGGGGNDYANNIKGPTCHGLAVGDSLNTEPGNMVGPTKNNIAPSVCSKVVNNDCYNLQNEIGVPMRTPFYLCSDGCNGKSRVAVTLLGSFTMMKFWTGKETDPDGTEHSTSEIQGVFNVQDASGSVGPGASTLQTLILAK